MKYTINIDLDRKCAECGKGGAVDSGICLDCTIKAMGKARLKSPQAKAIRARMEKAAGSVAARAARATEKLS